MFGMSMTEILVILAIVLVVLGPEKIPEVAKMIGKTLREVRKASNLLRDAVSMDDLTSPGKRNLQEIKPAELIPDVSPKTNVRVVDMTARRKPNGALTEVLLTAAKPEFPHREVYLHVPYEETI